MNYKKRDFLITNSVIILFVLMLSMMLDYYLTSIVGFDENTFMFITISSMFFGLIIYLILSKQIIEPLFRSDEKLKKAVKETLHELNIPISTVKINAQMLEKSLDNEKDLKRLHRIKKASNDLLKLYENMEYQIKKEIDKVDMTTFDLKDIIIKSIDKFDDIKRDIKIELDIQSISLNSDIIGFEKVIDNLISNALKYNLNENGYIKIDFKDKKLTIFNKGKEIDTKNLFILFDQYFQEDSSKNGYGLGLSMVKEFCDKNKIAIKIEPEKDGNRFILNLKNIIVKD